MDGIIVKYCQFKNIIERLPEIIKDKFIYDDSLLFSLLSFKSSTRFYAKKDKYDIYNKLNYDFFNEFIVECAINLSKENNYEKLLFLYGLIISNTSNYYLTRYLEQISDDYSIDESMNMTDKIIADKNEFKINNSLISQYPNSFMYYEYMDELIHLPFIKVFGFFSTNNYFSRAYKKMRKFYKSNTKKKVGSLNKKDTMYLDTYSTKIFNKDKNEFIIDDKKYQYDINEFMDFIEEKINKKIIAVNAYLFDNFDKDFKNEFNINEDKKI